MDSISKLLVMAFCCFVAFSCSNQPLEDAQVYGVYVVSDVRMVDLLVLDSTRRYTRMYWTASDGRQIYSGDWALLWSDGEDEIMFHDYNRLYQSDYDTQRGVMSTYVDCSITGNLRLALSPDEGKFYDRESRRPEEAVRMFDSLIEKRLKR